MKKIKSVLISVLTVLLLLPVGVSSVSAEEQLVIYDNYEIEISQEAVFAPAILSENYRYNASLYAFTDEDFTSPLCDKFDAEGYVITACGKYRVKYFLADKETGATSEKTAIISVTDTTVPVITLSGVYPEYFEIGDEVEFISASVKDNSGETLNYVVEVFLGENPVADNISEGKLKIKNSGTYRLVYTAQDSSGNVGKTETFFTVLQSENTDNGGEDGCKGGLSAESAALCAVTAAALAVLVLKRRKTL